MTLLICRVSTIATIAQCVWICIFQVTCSKLQTFLVYWCVYVCVCVCVYGMEAIYRSLAVQLHDAEVEQHFSTT